MRKNILGIFVRLLLIISFALLCNQAWALKNVCSDCNTLIENLDIYKCPQCGKVMNQCLICGKVNPVKNDYCENCNASLAESRVLRTIDEETRSDLQLGESIRARIEVELGQIEQTIQQGELTPALAVRQVELYTKMGWWSKVNTKAIEFANTFEDVRQNKLVSVCREKALRHLGYLAMQEKKYQMAIDYLKTALSIDPEDVKAKNLLKTAKGKK